MVFCKPIMQCGARPAMRPLLFILDGEELRGPELEGALLAKGWDTRWIGSADAPAMGDEGPSPSALAVNPRRGDVSVQAVRAFRDRDAMLPLILIGENAMGFPFGVDAHVPHGAAPEPWLAALGPFSRAPQGPPQSEGEEVFGKYRLKRKVAQGGSADIYQAEQMEPEGFSRILAIKRIREQHRQDPAYAEMLLDEANLAVRLDHQNIVRVFDFGIESGRHYIAMEYVDGGSLRSLIDRAKAHGLAFPEPIAAHIISQVAGALDHAHRRRDHEGQAMNLVHMDISPQNILVNRDGTAKLIDFGIAKAADPRRGGGGAAILQGKLPYMSPEQALGAAIDHRSDVYSLGLVLFELLTSKRCFGADDEMGLMGSIRSGAAPDIRELKRGTSRPMARVLDRALQKSVSSRYGSALEMAQDLSAYLGHLGLESLEGDAAAFLRMLGASRTQAKAFVQSRFLPMRSDFALPSEKAKKRVHEARGAQEGQAAKVRPAWILPAVGLLLALLACLFWASMDA